MRRNICTNYGTDSEEFKRYVGRTPTRKEMDEWVRLLQKGLEAQIDWDIICDCASDEFKDEQHENKKV